MAEETKIIRLVIDSSKAVDGGRAAQRALEQIERSTSSLDSAMARMEQSLGRVGGMIKAHLALMLAEMAARLVETAKAAVEAVGGLDELAEQLGLTTKGLQALQFSGIQNGLKLEQLETGAAKFSQKIGEAANGSKEMIEALDHLGVRILDVDKTLRPTEDIMSDVARAILAIEDPARRAAASVEFFGKAGTRFQPVLQDIARGFGFMGEEARKGGALVDEHVVKRLDQLSDALERGKLRSRAFFAEMAVAVLDMADKAVDAYRKILAQQATRSSGGGYQWERDFQSWVENAVSNMAGVGAGVVEVFRGAAEQVVKLWIDAFNRVLAGAEQVLNKLKEFSTFGLGDAIALGQIPGGGASVNDFVGGITQAAETARADTQAYYARQRSPFGKASSGAAWAVVNDGLPAQDGPRPGVFNPPVKPGGGGSEDSVDKLKRQTELAMQTAQALADVSALGSRAVADLELRFKAVKEVQDAYASSAHKAGLSVEELTKRIEDQQRAIERAKNLKDFNIETSTLQKANELLAAENRLIDQSTETRAVVIAQIKLKQELELKGIGVATEAERAAIAARGEAIAQNERLKGQAEELKRANELWTEPLKQAFRNIQTAGADAWDRILQSGQVSFQALGDIFKTTIRRMVAEFLALATIRPVMSVVVQGLGSLGVVSPAVAQQMGFGSSLTGSVSGGGSLGGGGMTMPSLGSSGGGGFWSGLGLGGVGDWLNTPFTGPYAGMSPSAMQGVPTLSPSMWNPSTWSITPLQGIGAAAGIGMGAYQLANSRSTGQTIAGIGSMVGGAVSLIPGLQPVGMAISLLSQFAPAIFGESNTRTHSSTNASLRYGNGNWYTTGGAYGPNANSGQSESALRGLTGGIDSVFGLLGGVKNASKVWGLNASSWTAQGKDWSYTSNATHLVDPETGSQEAWRMNMDDMMDTGAAQVAIRSILSGAVGEISATMKTALESMRAASMGIKETAESIVFVDEVYERLGKGALTVRTQFRELEKQFGDMTDKATKLGLALAPVEAEQKKATERLGQDYVDNLIDPVAAGLRAWEDEKQSILANIDYIKQHTDVVVDNARITEALLRRDAALKEQLYGGAISQLEDAIRRLSLGDLANLSPTTMLTGVQAAYQATVAQARSGDSSAIARVATEGTTFAQAAQSYYASGPDYEALKQQILDDLLTIQSQIAGGGSTTSSAPNDNNGATQAAVAQVTQLQSVVSEQSRQIAALMAKLSETNDLLLRRAVNG